MANKSVSLAVILVITACSIVYILLVLTPEFPAVAKYLCWIGAALVGLSGPIVLYKIDFKPLSFRVISKDDLGIMLVLTGAGSIIGALLYFYIKLPIC